MRAWEDDRCSVCGNVEHADTCTVPARRKAQAERAASSPATSSTSSSGGTEVTITKVTRTTQPKGKPRAKPKGK